MIHTDFSLKCGWYVTVSEKRRCYSGWWQNYNL